MIRTFEEYNIRNLFYKKRELSHPDIDPYGEEEWNEDNNLIPKEYFYKEYNNKNSENIFIRKSDKLILIGMIHHTDDNIFSNFMVMFNFEKSRKEEIDLDERSEKRGNPRGHSPITNEEYQKIVPRLLDTVEASSSFLWMKEKFVTFNDYLKKLIKYDDKKV